MDSKHFAFNDLKKRKYGLDGKIEGGGRGRTVTQFRDTHHKAIIETLSINLIIIKTLRDQR
jgi:hypothetical protein